MNKALLWTMMLTLQFGGFRTFAQTYQGFSNEEIDALKGTKKYIALYEAQPQPRLKILDNVEFIKGYPPDLRVEQRSHGDFWARYDDDHQMIYVDPDLRLDAFPFNDSGLLGGFIFHELTHLMNGDKPTDDPIEGASHEYKAYAAETNYFEWLYRHYMFSEGRSIFDPIYNQINLQAFFSRRMAASMKWLMEQAAALASQETELKPKTQELVTPIVRGSTRLTWGVTD